LSKNSIQENESLTASINVTNKGSKDKKWYNYTRDVEGSITRPVKELKGFEKITLKPGETKTVTFKITPELLKFYNSDLDFVAEPGDFDIMIGTNSQEEKI
jgi:beta-glucosidase